MQSPIFSKSAGRGEPRSEHSTMVSSRRRIVLYHLPEEEDYANGMVEENGRRRSTREVTGCTISTG